MAGVVFERCQELRGGMAGDKGRSSSAQNFLKAGDRFWVLREDGPLGKRGLFGSKGGVVIMLDIIKYNSLREFYLYRSLGLDKEKK